ASPSALYPRCLGLWPPTLRPGAGEVRLADFWPVNLMTDIVLSGLFQIAWQGTALLAALLQEPGHSLARTVHIRDFSHASSGVVDEEGTGPKDLQTHSRNRDV